MPPKLPLHPEQRAEIIDLRRNGLTYKEISEALNIPLSTVGYTVRRYENYNTIINIPHSRRIPRDVAALEIIDNTIRHDFHVTRNEIRQELQQQNIQRSQSQVSRRIHHQGRVLKRERYSQTITFENIQKRVQYRHFILSTNQYFYEHIFVDECMVLLMPNNTYQWCFFDEQPIKQPRYRNATGLLIYGGVSRRGRTDFITYPSTSRIKSERYCNMVGKVIYPFMKKRFDMDCKLVQDNASCHKSAHTKSFLRTLGIRCACFPPNSPDFNPIEYLWRDLKRFVTRRNPRNVEDLKLTILEFLQNEVTVSYCNKIIDAARINIQRSTDGLNHEGNNPTNRLYH